MAFVGYVEQLVNTQSRIRVEHKNLKSEVEEVKAGFAVIPGRTRRQSRDRCNSPSEKGSECEQRRGEEKNGDLGLRRSLPKGERRKCDHGRKDPREKLHVPIDAEIVGIDGLDGLHRDGDRHGEE